MSVVRKVHSGRTPESLKPKVTRTVSSPESASKSKDSEQEGTWAYGPPFDSHLEYETSDEIDQLAKAFVAFRAVCPNVDKDRDGYNYKYATLGNIIAKSREHLKKAGLAIMQFPIAGTKSLGVITVLLHESGQFIRARFLMPIPSLSSTNVTQDAGAAITYARRYSISAVLCIASDEDTDASYSGGSKVSRRK